MKKERFELQLEQGDAKRLRELQVWMKEYLELSVPKSEVVRYAIRCLHTDQIANKAKGSDRT